jgi:uncharacterized protein YgiM (DUF1202 family)
MNRLLLLLPLLLLACTLSSVNTESGINTPRAKVLAITPQPTQTEQAPDIRTVTADTLNVRSCPSTSCAGVDVLEHGQSVNVIRVTRSNWCQIGDKKFVACWWLE